MYARSSVADVTHAGANFTAYQELKKLAHGWQPELTELPSYQHMIIGLISGAMGPFSNAPIDTIKTRTSPPRRPFSLPAYLTHASSQACRRRPPSRARAHSSASW